MSRNYDKIIANLRAVISNTPYEGEKNAANHQLDRILKKLGMTKDDLDLMDCDGRKWRTVKIHKRHRKLSTQIAFYYVLEILQDRDHPVKVLLSGPDKGNFLIYCKESERIEFLSIYEFFYSCFIHSLDIHFSAFLRKNQLLCKTTPEEAKRLMDRLDDPKQFAKEIEIEEMAEGMKRNVFNKPIGHKDQAKLIGRRNEE